MAAWTIDWFSSAPMFPGWVEYGEQAFLWRGPVTYDPLVVYQPKMWLLREDWKKAGAMVPRRSGERTQPQRRRRHRSRGGSNADGAPASRSRRRPPMRHRRTTCRSPSRTPITTSTPAFKPKFHVTLRVSAKG